MPLSRTVMRRSSPLSLAWLAVGLFVLLGCNSGIPLVEPAAEMLWPFEERQRTTFRTPAQRIEALKELAQDSRAYDTSKQQEISTVLSQQIRNEPDPIIRRQIVKTLGTYDTDAAIAVLHAGCQDKNPEVRVASCQAFARRGGPAALAALDRALREDKDIDVRLAAAKALGGFKDQQAVAALGMALEDSDPALQYVAVQSLKKSTGRNLGDDVNVWRKFTQSGAPALPSSPSFTERVRNSSPF